jgi:hypothetical protein
MEGNEETIGSPGKEVQRLEVGRYQQGADEIRTAPSQHLTNIVYPLLTPLVVSIWNKQVHVTPRTGDYKDEEYSEVQIDRAPFECGHGYGDAGGVDCRKCGNGVGG